MSDTTMPDLSEYRLAARRWLEDNLEPVGDVARASHDDDYTDEYMQQQRRVQRQLFDGGYAGVSWPKEYGGQGLSPAHETAFDEEGRDFAVPDFGKTWQTTFGVCGPMILACATDDFKRRHIPRVLAGEELIAQFFSEPSAGSDLAAVKTTAVRDGDGWRINGSKTWSSYAHRCDIGVCLARTDPSAPKHKGLTWFAIPTDAAGVTVRPFRMIDGTSAFCEEFFDDVWIPDTERIGEVNEGWSVTHVMLQYERDSERMKDRAELSPGPLAPDLVELARAVGRDGDPAVEQLIATAHVNAYVLRQLHVRIARCLEGEAVGIGPPAFGKLGRGTFDPIRARIELEIAGDAAIAWPERTDPGYRAALHFLNGRVYSIAGGTNEMQRNAVAERVHGLPR